MALGKRKFTLDSRGTLGNPVRQVVKMSQSKTKAEHNLEGQNRGISHYTVLLKLEYFVVIRFSTINPMHQSYPIFFLALREKCLKYGLT